MSTFRFHLLQLLNEIGSHDTDVRERAEQAIAALYRLEWALRRDGCTEIAINSDSGDG